jgi:hypothetical protein
VCGGIVIPGGRIPRRLQNALAKENVTEEGQLPTTIRKETADQHHTMVMSFRAASSGYNLAVCLFFLGMREKVFEVLKADDRNNSSEATANIRSQKILHGVISRFLPGLRSTAAQVSGCYCRSLVIG